MPSMNKWLLVIQKRSLKGEVRFRLLHFCQNKNVAKLSFNNYFMLTNVNQEVAVKKIYLLIPIFLFILSIFQLSFAQKKRTGEVEGNVFTDKRFGYNLTFLSNWKLKTEKEPSLIRATLTKKNYEVDRTTRFASYEVTIPTIIIIADTTQITLEEFSEALLKDKKKLKNRQEYVLKLDFLTDAEKIEEKEVLVDSVRTKMLTFRKKYLKTVEDPRKLSSSEGGNVIVEEFIVGYLLLFKKGANMFVVQFSCERQFISPNHREFTAIMEGWKFKK
jgi:hypothetical protein